MPESKTAFAVGGNSNGGNAAVSPIPHDPLGQAASFEEDSIGDGGDIIGRGPLSVGAIPLENPSPQCSDGWSNPYQLMAMISNFSTSYNVVNISLVLPILEHLYPLTSDNSGDAAASASSLLAGMMVGQVIGGALGDSCVGRLGALAIVMTLQILASLASSVLQLSTGSTETHGNIYLQLAACRFLLGVGAGGVYPLAAVLSAEQGNQQGQSNTSRIDSSREAPGSESTASKVGLLGSPQVDTEQRTPGTQDTEPSSSIEDAEEAKQVHRVVLTFSMQGLGFITVPIVAVVLLHVTDNLDLVWRVMLGIGSIPGIGLVFLQYQLYRMRRATADVSYESLLVNEEPTTPNVTAGSVETTEVSSDDEENPASDREVPAARDGVLRDAPTNHRGFWYALRNEPGLGKKLIGTAGTWFLFDVLFYGNTLFQPIVIEAAFGSGAGSPMEMLRKTCLDSLILTSIALPGYFVAGIVMGKRTCCVTQTPRYVMLQGFAAMTVLYLTIGLQWDLLRQYPSALVTLYGSTFFFANYGPNTSTFLLPSMVYAPDCRSTLNGISAAAGKLGALVGASLFSPAADQWGDAIVMQLCACVAAFSFLVTYVFVPDHGHQSSS